jgi:hypothetical protein
MVFSDPTVWKLCWEQRPTSGPKSPVSHHIPYIGPSCIGQQQRRHHIGGFGGVELLECSLPRIVPCATVQQQLASPPVQLTLAMLREAKRYVQISFMTISKLLVDVDDGVCAYFLTK